METPAPPPQTPTPRLRWGALIALIWVVPLAILAVRLFVAGGGWDLLFLIIYAPIWYPVLGVLGMIPRWTWRQRAGKHADPPAGIMRGFIVHWSGLLLMAIAAPGVGDSGAFASLLRREVHFFDERGEQTVTGIGLFCALAGLLIAIVVAGSRNPAAAPAGTRSGWLTLGAWLVIPLALALGCAAQLLGMSAATDAAGRTELQASRLSRLEAATAEQGYWDELQRVVIPVREALAPRGWQLRSGSGIHDWDLGDNRLAARAVWEMRSDSSAEELVEQLRAELRRGGWQADPEAAQERGWIEPNDLQTGASDVAFESKSLNTVGDNIMTLWSKDGTGNHLSINFWIVEKTGATGVQVIADGPEYWTGPRLTWREPELAELGGSTEYLPPRGGMRADEWPALGPVERGSLSFIEDDAIFPGEGTE